MSFTIEEEILHIIKSKKVLLSAKKILSLADSNGELASMSVQSLAHFLKKMYEDGKIGMVKISAGNRFCQLDLQKPLAIKANQEFYKNIIVDAIINKKKPLTVSEIFKVIKPQTEIKINEDDVKTLLDGMIKEETVQIVSNEDESCEEGENEILYGVKKASKSKIAAKVEYVEKDGGYEVSYEGSKSARTILFVAIFGCSLLLAGAIGFVSSFLSIFINEIVVWLIEGLNIFHVPFSSKSLLTISLISSGVLSLILSVISVAVIVAILTNVENCDAPFWDDVALTFGKASLYILPQFIVTIGLCAWFAPSIKTLFETFSFSNLSEWHDSNLSAHVAGASACIVSLLISSLGMLGCFAELACPHCKKIGTISYSFVNKNTNFEYKFDETKNIHDEVKVGLYEITTEKVYYKGTCCECGGKKDRVDTSKSKAKVY